MVGQEFLVTFCGQKVTDDSEELEKLVGFSGESFGGDFGKGADGEATDEHHEEDEIVEFIAVLFG